MWDRIIEFASTNGIWALLFCSLLIYQLKDGAAREKKYQETIDRLSGGLSAVRDLKGTLESVREEMGAKLDRGFGACAGRKTEK